ncbi:pre-peptidase C-terminal domain-containing protein [Plectonema cf. radiosum LEGE 06105]|uniref:Pre-peptidase C-terminal domain-containing protein n=1 Tax=Plectonema cf. radiosum LEGE 06105 TaxID=945769 RepID=A0A8J7F4J9_9CYAN|nr:pre-peptidase C-terminal domain-containing protein [Plectonema radiosum]MBE9215027.1 pre-peptidase C-terminal domain-containing protein [Plectonema cf. radiosum LEGE 06105]
MSNYDERIDGDISNDPTNPLELSLSEATTTVTATTGDGDQEYLTVTVPEGSQLNSVVLESYNPNDVAFIGVQQGDTFTEPLDNSAIRENILGYTLFGNPRQVGTDILDEIGNGLNAIGFEGALPSGDYTFAIQQLGPSSDYTLAFNLGQAVSQPEPNPEPTPTPTPPTEPGSAIVSLTADKTDVVEGDSITLTLSVDGDIPANGITVLINDINSVENQRRSLTEFDIFNIELTGISGFPRPAQGDSGFFVTITEPTATITLPIFDEGANEDEALESFTFAVIDGEGYQVDSENSAITLNIIDAEDFNNPEPPINQLPVISIDTLAGTFDGDDNLITPNLVDSIEEGTPILSVAINSNVDIPEDGLIVNINTDLADISELVAEPAFAPFTFGGEFIGAIYNDAGVATGFQVKLLNPNTVINFSDVALGEGIQQFNLFVEPSEDYIISNTKDSSAVTIYDTLDQVPTTTATPTVGMSISENLLIEGETETTISFNVDGEIPPEGVIVLVDSDVRFALGEFNLLNATVEGGVFPVTNGDSSGFYFKITEPEASITLTPRNDNLNADGQVITEGIEEFTFTLQQQVGYIIDDSAAAVNFRIADDADSQIQVSLTTEPEILIEESETAAVLTLNLSAPPPSEGITVAINSENLDDFNTLEFDVTGGNIVSIDDATVNVLITEQTATVTVPVKDDGIVEGLETAVFTLVEPPADAGYQIGLNPQANQSSFDIYDTVNNAPVIVLDVESNDTIATSTPLEIDSQTNKAIVRGQINFNFQNNRDVDQTEDVDMYSVELQAGDRITIDLDSIPFENSQGFVLRGSGDLRVFNSAGEELVYNAEDSAPGELLESRRDAYIDFTAETAGTYYIGVSQAFNENYDPFVKGTGDGALLSPSFGIGAGRYELDVKINPEPANFEQYVEYDGETPNSPVVKFNAVPGTFEGNDIISSQIIESLGTETGKAALLNFTFQVDGEIPDGGLEVIVKSDTDFSGFFDNLTGTPRTAVGGEIISAVYNEDGTPAGFKALLTSPNAAFPFPVSDRDTDDPNTPESIVFSLANSPDYAADTTANTSNITFYDTLEQIQSSGNVPQVGVTIDQTELIESEGTQVNVSFNVEGEIPSDGLLVYVDSETRGSLGEFDVFNTEITGGAVPSANGDASGFYFRIFENTANLKLQVFDETTNPLISPEDALEGIEEFSFSLIESDGYTIDTNASGFSFTIADNPDSVVIVPPEEPEELPQGPTDNDGRTTNNDTIADAVPLSLNLADDNLSVTIDGAISERFRGTDNTVDATEDVDMYSFDLMEGQTITIDIDANGTGNAGLGSILDSVLRIFDAEGNELVVNNQGAAPDEIFQAEGDPYLEFTAPAAGTYYAGISALGNDFYDPNVANSGSGWTFGESFGADIYRVSFSLGDMVAPPTEPDSSPIFGSLEQDIIEVEGSNGLIFAGNSDDLIDASISSSGNNRIYAGSGDDTVILGMSDRIIGGAGDDKFFALSGGDNIITGGAGADQFWIATTEIPQAANIITDFTSGEDVLGIAGLGIGFDDLSITGQDDNTLIGANGSDLAILQGIGATSLSADNFAFV